MPEKGNNKGELPPEVDKYLASLIKDPKSKAFVPLADAYRKAGMLDEAIKVAVDGLKHNPSYVSGRFVLGRCYFEKNMNKEAEEELTKVIKLNPDNIEAQRILARIMEREGRIEEAGRAWQIILTLKPDDAEAKAESTRYEEAKPQIPETESTPPATQEQEVKTADEEQIKPAEQAEPGEIEEPSQEGVRGSAEPPREEQQAVSPEREMEEAKETEEELVSDKTGAGEEGWQPRELAQEQEPEERAESPAGAEAQPETKVVSDEQDEKTPEARAVRDTPLQVQAGSPMAEKASAPPQDSPAQAEAGISSRSLAELYVKQGYLDRALKVYTELMDSSPGDKEILQRIEFIKSELVKKSEAQTQHFKIKQNIKTLSNWLDKIKKGG